MNHIDIIRTEINKHIIENTFEKGILENFISPSKKFRIETTNLSFKESNYDLTKIEIIDIIKTQKIFEFYVNDSNFFHSFLSINNIDYLICAEDIYGGQTVIDLTNRIMKSHSTNEDGFIWTDFYLSPNGKKLATVGCYWACPYVIKLFDFSEPMNLPLNEIKEIDLLDNDEIIVGWLDNETLQMKGFKRDREPEYFDGGSFRMKIINETKVERQIKINGT